MYEQALYIALDSIAARFVAMNEPLRLAVAESPAERDAIYRLRYQEVIGRGWSKPDDFPDQMERDEYDDDAVQIAAWEDSALAGCARLIFPAPDRPLPIETSYNVVIEPQGQVVYLSRVLVAPAHRGKGHHLTLGLLGKSWQEIRARGYRHLCGAFSETVMPVFQNLGVHIVLLGVQDYLGEKRYACYIDMLQTARALTKNFPASS